ncbi:MAG TPA: PEP-CTERM sorting domain-containing protein [Roseiarcus sp.]
MKVMTSSALALTLSAGLASAAHAAQTQIDLSSLTNENIQTYTNGTNYPLAGSTVNINAASFTLSSMGGPDTTGVIQANSPTDSFVIPINEAGYSIVYVLMNSAFGELGSTVGSLVFQDSAGDSDTISLEEGVNVRDHYIDFNNVATEVYGTAQYPGDVKLDAYEYLLPASFAGNTLTSITLSGAPDTGSPNGEPFLAAVTLATGASPVPEPSTWAMMIAGFAGLGWLGFSRRRAIGSAAA